MIDALISSFRDQIGFMPNAYIATVTDILAKARPGRQMGQIRLLRTSSESPKGLPVLKEQHRPTKSDVAAHKPDRACAEARLSIRGIAKNTGSHL